MAQPFFSIIVCIYNGEKFIDKCLNSVIKQKFSDWELVIINDGSTDGTELKLKKYAKIDARINIVNKYPNEGVFKGRKTAIENANGKYITFLDVDDYFINNKMLSGLYGYLQDETIDLVQFGYFQKFNHLGKIHRLVDKPQIIYRGEFLSEDIPTLLCNNWWKKSITYTVWGKVYKRNILNPVLSIKSETHFLGEDLIINLNSIIDCKKILIIPEVYYLYNDLTGGTNKFDFKSMNDLSTIKEYQLACLEKLYNSSVYTQEQYERIKNGMYAEVAAYFLLYMKEAKNHLKSDEIKDFIENIINLPSFVKAREYYINKFDEHWEAVDLLREGNIDYYMKVIEKSDEHPSLKKRVVDGIKCLYKKI